MALTWLVHTDLAAISRGRAIPDYDPEGSQSVGWVSADLALDPFGGLVDNPWGPVGDLRLVPDPATLVRIPGTPTASEMNFVLCTATDLEGRPWRSCPRGALLSQVARLEEEFGLSLLAAFEQEFSHVTDAAPPAPFSIEAARVVEPLLEEIFSALDRAGVEPENILPEFGQHQFELTTRPAVGVAAADRAVITRTVVREIARRQGRRVTFAPMIGPGAGSNGVHIHFSLLDSQGTPVTHDPGGDHGLSVMAQQFAAGIVAHLPALTALTAPSVASYLRLRPHSWSAAYVVFGNQNREAAVRVAPRSRVDGNHDRERANLEYRPSDGAANPYLALAGLLVAGMDGLERELPCPESVEFDPSVLSEAELKERGISRLPQSLGEALDCLERDSLIAEALDSDLLECYLTMKRNEVAMFAGVDEAEVITRYVDAY